MWPLTSSITYHIMCPQSMAALIMQHSLYCVTHHHRFSMSFAWSLSRRWKRECTFYILLVARILLDMYSIVLSCGCFEPKSQKYQVTLLSFFFYPTTLCKHHLIFILSFTSWHVLWGQTIRCWLTVLLSCTQFVLLWYQMSAKHALQFIAFIFHVQFWF